MGLDEVREVSQPNLPRVDSDYHDPPTTRDLIDPVGTWISRREEMTHLISLYICRFLCIYIYIYIFFFQTCIFMYLSNICIYICIIFFYVYTQKSPKRWTIITRKNPHHH